MLGFYDGDEQRIFASVREFLDAYLTDSYRSFTCYAHNAERFDFKFLIQELLNMEVSENTIEAVNGKRLTIKFLQAGERIREIHIKDGNRNYWRFADSFWLIPSSLEKATKAFNVPSIKTKIDFNKISIHDPASREYCLNDCRGLWQVLGAYFKQKVFKGLKPKGTIASNAMQIYRAGMKEPLKGIDRDMEAFIRRSYFGGRVEIFKLEGYGLNCYDFNSLYPATMIENTFPVGLPVWVDTWADGLPGYYEAEVDYPDHINIPCLPIVKDGKLIFPVGRFRGFFSSCELERAKEDGARVRIFRGVVFHISKAIFESYVNQLYEMKARAEKDGADYMIAKLYLNGLYGKFGQRREQTAIIRCSSEEAAEKGFTPYLPDFGLYLEKSQSRGAYIMPNIAAWVTAKARLRLHDVLTESVHYCDTDSVFTPDTLANDPVKLGALKFEKRVDHAYFILPKLYRLELSGGKFETKAKGYGREFTAGITSDDFRAALRGDYRGFKVEVKKLFGIKESLRRFGKCPVAGIARKSLHTTYNKRKVMPDLSTRPWVLNGFTSAV